MSDANTHHIKLGTAEAARDRDPFSFMLEEGWGVQFAWWQNRQTYQWRRDTLEEPTETFLACDGHQRMEGRQISDIWRWILEPVFHFL